MCLFTINLLPAFIVLNSREIVCQRGWRPLATEYAGVDKLADNLQSDTKDSKKNTFLDSGQLYYLGFEGPMQVNRAFHGIEKSRVINKYILLGFKLHIICFNILNSHTLSSSVDIALVSWYILVSLMEFTCAAAMGGMWPWVKVPEPQTIWV